MLEAYEANSVSVELSAAIEQAISDLNEVADRLERASLITREELRRQFKPREVGVSFRAVAWRARAAPYQV